MSLLIALGFFATPSLQAAGTLYCKPQERVIDALQSKDKTSHYSPDCLEAILLGKVCFTGSRKSIIEILNGDQRIGSDEVWVESARYKGRNLQYTTVDGSNDWEYVHEIKRCTESFLRSSQPEQLPLFPETEVKKDIDALRVYLGIDTEGSWVKPYYVKSLQLVTSKILASYQEANDRIQGQGGNANIIEHFAESTSESLIYWMQKYGQSPEPVSEDFEPLFRRMIEEGVVLKIIAVSPPDSCKQSEACAWRIFHVFLSNGEHYYLHFDFAT